MSQFSIKLFNIQNNDTIYQKLVLVTGQVESNLPQEGEIIIYDRLDIPLAWPVKAGLFKALIPLDLGSNFIRFVYLSSELTIQLHYIQPNDVPKYQLVIMIASDSNLVIDGLPEQARNGENGLEKVKEKFRMAAYLWQAFIGEQMLKAGFGRRSIQFEEVLEKDTIINGAPNRLTAQIKVIQTQLTMEQLRDKHIAQQYKPKENEFIDKNKPSLFSIFSEALKQYPNEFQRNYKVAGLVLDTQWNKNLDTVFGHAALGGNTELGALGIFGSHTTYSWPSKLDEVPYCFLNKGVVDTCHIADECRGRGQHYNSCNIGIGAFLHEVGHSLGLPHTPHGIMSRGFEDLNQAFMSLSPSNQSIGTMDTGGACFHRTNCNRLRLHPCLKLPFEPKVEEVDAAIYPIDHGLLIEHDYGVGQIVFREGETILNTTEYIQPLKEIVLEFSKYPQFYENKEILLEINCIGKTTLLNDVNKFIREAPIIVPGFQTRAFKGRAMGYGHPDDAQPFQILFQPSHNHFIIHSGLFVDGIKVNQNLVGGQGGGRNEFLLKEGEKLLELEVNGGYLIDGFRLVTDQGRSSDWFGGSGGGKARLRAPKGCEIIGLYGLAGKYLYKLGIIYKGV